MDNMEFDTSHDRSSENGGNYEAREEHWDEESCEEINPLGLLDLVYVEEEEEMNKNRVAGPSSSAVSNSVEQLNHVTYNMDEDDEGEELEPVAAVDVSPVRAEDFFPEGPNEDALDSTKSMYSASWTLNADVEYHPPSVQQNQGVDIERTLQLMGRHSQHTWDMQRNHFMSVQHPHQVSWELPHPRNGQFQQHSDMMCLSQLSWALPQRQEEVNDSSRLLSRRQYYQRYRQKNPELVRIRNREYARRYRQAHADRVRERQREYIKRYRERKRQLEEENIQVDTNSEQNRVIVMSDRSVQEAVMTLNSESKENKVVVQSGPNEQKVTYTLSTKYEPGKVINEIQEQDEVLILN